MERGYFHKLLTILFVCFFHMSSYSKTLSNAEAEKALTEALKYYDQRIFSEAINEIEKLKNVKKFKALAYYWEGSAYYQLSDYYLAIESLEIAKKYKFKADNLYFMLGQSHYAMNHLSKARRYFGLSAKKGYKVPASLYYIAYSSKKMKQNSIAIKYFRKIEKLSDEVAGEFKQGARYMLAQIYRDESQKHPKKLKVIKKFVVPQYEKALDYDESGPLANKISTELEKIMIDNGLLVTKMYNGRPIPKKRWYSNINLAYKYDDNIVLQADQATSTAQNKDANLLTYGASLRHVGTIYNIAQVQPQVTFSRTYHTNRSDSNIYQNDTYSLTGALRTQWEHKLFNEFAATLIDFTYTYSARDVGANQNVRFFTRSLDFSIGEKLKLTKRGETTILVKRNHTYNVNPSSNSTSNTFTLNQTLGINGVILIPRFSATGLRNVNPFNDTDAFTFGSSLIFPNTLGFNLINFGLNATFTNTKEQKATRGTEKMYVPSFSLGKSFGKTFWTFSYTYTKNDSLDKQNQAYSKTLWSLQGMYSF